MNRVIIIAEAGVNHNGDIKIAKELIDVASNSGVDYVKFQTFLTEEIVDINAPKADYQNDAIGSAKTQYQMIKELELPFEAFIELKAYCELKGVKFLTTAADLISLKKIAELNLDFIKVSSGEITNPLFLSQVARLNKPVILSTGMCTMAEIETAITILTSKNLNRNDITILHCNTEYPTPMRDVNLNAMKSIADAFKVSIGYSDHTLGIEVPIAAVAMGAKVIEKHFTLDKRMIGPDHGSSLEPKELLEMVKAIRNIEAALGDGIKRPSISEAKNLNIVRKSIFLSQNIEKGELLTVENLTVKRPGDGIPAMHLPDLLGKPVNCNLIKGQKLDYKNIQW